MRKTAALILAIGSMLITSYTSDADAVWVQDGVLVGINPNPIPYESEITSDGFGGAIITWRDGRNGTNDIYAQRIDASGVIQWNTDGEAICTAAGNQIEPRITSDGIGGAIITWQDYRNGTDWDIYSQRIDASGTVQWTIDGEVICSSEMVQNYPQITSDGTGGAIITWQVDYTDIYAQRIDASGTVQWTIDGEVICSNDSWQDSPQITSDGSGGAIITWTDYRSIANDDIYSQRVDASGVVQWATGGEAVCTVTGDQYYPQIISDGIGGAVITWTDLRDGNDDIYSQRIDASGTVQWIAGGEAICTVTGDQYDHQIASDGSGGAIVTWQVGYNIYAQRIDADGSIPAGWAAGGEEICTETGDQIEPRITSDGSGGAIITWQDYRSGNQEIHTQLINAGGVGQWTVDGEAICTYARTQESPQITSDGAGGAIITWWDYRHTSWDIYAQRVDASGVVQWATSGEAICTVTGGQYDHQIASDGIGGAIITWVDERNGNFDIYAQRIDASGVIQWTTDGGAICTYTGDQEYLQIISDGIGGAIITWQDYRSGNSDIYAQRIDASGTVQWTTGGEGICTNALSQYSPQITSDGSGGAIITWKDYRSGRPQIYFQRIDVNGVIHWTSDGEAISLADGTPSSQTITSDGSGGAIITWGDYRHTSSDIYAQRIDANGVAQWTTGGEAICTYTGDQTVPWITSDGVGGAIITWWDYRHTSWDIYAQRVDASGVVRWATSGEAICTVTGDQYDHQIASDGIGGAIITWVDERNGNFDIYAQQIDASGVVRWTVDGEAICSNEEWQLNPQITSDNSGGAIITWGDRRSGESRIYAQAVTDLGFGPICGIYPASITLTDLTQVGAAVDTVFTISNTGLGPLVGNVGEECDHFSIVSGDGSFYLLNGESHIVTVRFEPTVSGTHLCIIDTGIYLCSDVTITGQAYSCPPDTVLYVDADATGLEDGSSWADAFASLQDALARAELCDNVTEIWVAEGTYVPTADTIRTATFQLRDSLAIYGRFAGTETMLSERDLAANETVLSGDIGVADDSSDNCYHVVTASGTDSTAVLDGFVITNGNADGGGEDNNGGGIYNSGGSPIIQNIWLYDQSAAMFGSGMYNTGADPRIQNAIFFDEIFNDNASFPAITNSAILESKISNDDSSPLIYNTILWRTEAGPVVTNTGASSPSFRNSLVKDSGGSLDWDTGFGTNLGGNIDTDPLFVDGAGGDLRLQVGSPAIDSGDNSAPNLPSTDIAGNPRIVDGTVDMGPYEDAWGSVPPRNAASPSNVDFDRIAVGSTHDTTYTITNSGGGTLSGNVSEACSFYSITSGGGPFSLAHGESHVVGVCFAPTATGMHKCLIETNSNGYGRLVLVADRTSGVHVFHAEDPSTPIFTGTYDTAGDARDVFVVGSNAYVADWTSGLQMIEISDPANPTLLGTYNTPGFAYGVTISGDYALVADGSPGLQVIEISDPANPMLLGTYNTPGLAYAVTVSGDYAFVADRLSGLQVIDISDPANPTLLGTYDTPGEAWGITVSGDYAFVADGASGLQVIDISDPANPTLLGAYNTSSYANGVAVLDDYAMVADATSGLQVIDISDPANPTLLGAYNTSGYAQAVTVSGDYAFVADGSSGLRVIDVSDPTNPGLVGFYNTPEDAQGVTVVPGGDVACSGYAGFEYALIDSIIDVPGDQGGQVRIHLTRSIYDFTEEMELPITLYTVYRRVDGAVAVAAISESGKIKGDSGLPAKTGSAVDRDGLPDWPIIEHGGRLFVQSSPELASNDFPTGTWEIVYSIGPTQQQDYTALVPTLVDSSQSGIPYEVFVITAHTTTPAIWFTSPPDSGYSVDNIAPGVPLGLAVAYNTGGGNELSWDASPEPDFQYYRIYRGDSETFTPGPGSLVHETVTPDWSDPDYDGWEVHYKVTALDHVGNESDVASATSTTGDDTPQAPDAFALYQNVPNPFNPTTTIRFDLPKASYVKLSIFNVKGELVSTIADRQMSEGHKEFTWTAKDNRGRAVSSGIYFYRLVAGDFVQTRKMVLLR